MPLSPEMAAFAAPPLGWLQHEDGTWSSIDAEGREHTMALGPWDDSGELRELDAEVRGLLAVLDALEARSE